MNPDLQKKRSIGVLKAFLFFVIFCFYNLATSQTQNGKAVNSYNVCLIVEETQFDEGCLGNGLDNEQRRALTYITNNCDQEIIVEAIFTGEFIDSDGNPTAGNSDTEYGIKPGERRRFEFCKAKNGTGTIRVIRVQEAGSTSYSSNSAKNNSYSSNSAYNAPSGEATQAMSIAEINRQRQESQQNNSPRKKTDLELENERKAFHQDHVRKNNESYARRQQQQESQDNANYVTTQKDLEMALRNQASPEEVQKSREYSDMMMKKVEDNLEEARFKNEVNSVAGSQILSGDLSSAVTTYAQAGMTTEALTVAGLDLAFSIFGEITRSNSQKKARKAASAALVRSQEQALDHIQKINKNLLAKFLELQKIPVYTYYNEKILDELLAHEVKLKEYELSTAGERLLLLTYHAADERMTVSELETSIENIRKMGREQGVEGVVQQIEPLQARFKIQEIPHLGNMGEGFSSLLGKINMYKARCYEAMGESKKAASLRGNIEYIASPDDAVKLVLETYRDRNYLATSKYAEVLQDHFLNVVPHSTVYEDLNNLSFNFKGLIREEATFLLALGVMAEIKTGQSLKARESLQALVEYQELLELHYKKYLKKKEREKIYLSDKKFQDMVHVSSSITSAVTAFYEVKNENREKGWEKFRHARALYGSVPSIPDKFHIWFDNLELEILMELERYEEARTALVELKSSIQKGISETYAIPIDQRDLDFNNAYIRYKMKDNKGALFALRIMEQKNGPDLRMYSLSEQIYREIGDVAKAEDSKEKYLSLLTNDY